MIPDHDHLCAVCGAWGAFGIKARPGDLAAPITWYCAAHRPPPAKPLTAPTGEAVSTAPRQGKLL